MAEMKDDPGKFYARASARLMAALGERPTKEEIERLHEDAEAAFSAQQRQEDDRLAKRSPELERMQAQRGGRR